MNDAETAHYEQIKDFIASLREAAEKGGRVEVPGVSLQFDEIDVLYMVAPPHPDMRWLSARVVLERLEASARRTLQLVVNEFEALEQEPGTDTETDTA
jgi:hypothetical protein